MAHINCDFTSDVLGMGMSMSVILPQSAYSNRDKLPVLYLLHGLSDDHTIWSRRTSIERYAEERGLAVVMPNAHRSFFVDMDTGENYFSYIADEVPEIARKFFNLSEKRADNFVAGLSMGGYGAFKLALTYPERYAAGASLSGALGMALPFIGEQNMNLIYGNQSPIGGVNDLSYLAGKLKNYDGEIPALYQCCGTEDFLYDENIMFRDCASDIGLNLLYQEGTGTHEWGYWDANIKKIIDWLPIR